MKNKLGFTLIELLVVVLIIGILAAVALPQYQMAVEKARVAQILPMMKNIYDALALYKLEHGNYGDGSHALHWDQLSIDPPSGFWTSNGNTEFGDDKWYCFPNEELVGYVYCDNEHYRIWMIQPDDMVHAEFAGKRLCSAWDDFGIKLCKALGGKELEGKMWGDTTFEF